MYIRIYDTPEAGAEGKKCETLRVLDENADGILAARGEDWWVFLTWEYLAKYGYQYQ